MLTEADKWELVRRYGGMTKTVAEPLVAALAGLLAEKDVMGLSFLVESVDGILKSAIEHAGKIQIERGIVSETLH
jgi:hypothetical protein